MSRLDDELERASTVTTPSPRRAARRYGAVSAAPTARPWPNTTTND